MSGRSARSGGHDIDVTSMIVDCYTHTWQSSDQLGRCLPPGGLRERVATGSPDPIAGGPAAHLAASEPVATTIVLGFKSAYLGAHIPNDEVAAYVAKHHDRMTAFAGVDPSEPKEAIAELRRARDEWGMRGAAIAPAAQDFHPSNSQAMLVYAQAAELQMPILFHPGVFMASPTKLEYARPVLLDEVARELPRLKLIIAHMGHPWIHETLVLLAKHRNVYAEISRLLLQPWQAYEALRAAYQFGVMDKLLFGSGFPVMSASQAIEAIYSLNHLVHGTNLPGIPREQLRGIVERDTLGLLGIAPRREPAPVEPAVTVGDE